MATYNKPTPFADWVVPAPGVQLMSNTYRAAELDAITGFEAISTNTLPLSGNTDLLARFLATSESYQYGDEANIGRWLQCWDVSASGFLTGERLLGAVNVNAPDSCVMNDTIFYCDTQGRWGAGTAPATYVFSDDAGVFTDESVDAADNGAGDVQIMPSAAQAANDAFYVGADATFQGVYIYIDRGIVIGSSGSATYALEYWDSASWTSLGVTGDPGNDASIGLVLETVGPQIVTWTIPGDWATTTVNSQSAYWVRIRATGASGTGYTSPTATKVFIIESSAATKGRVPAAWHLTSNPTSNGVVKGWGLWRLETGNTAQVTASLGGSGTALTGVLNVYYTWYDSARDIESDPVLIGSLSPTAQVVQVTTGHHPDHRVNQVRIYFEGISGALAVAPTGSTSTTIGTGKLRLVGTINTGTTNSGITVALSATSRPEPYGAIDRSNVGDGPYVASSVADEYTKPATTHGTYVSCCTHLRRVWCGGTYVDGYERRLVWSNINNGWTFPSTNYADVPMGAGDRIQAVRSLGSSLVILGRRSVWLGTGDPGQGQFTLQQVANVGATSTRGCVVAGQRCFFIGESTIYVIDASGSVQDVGGRVGELIRDCTAGAMGNACGVYDPTREVIVWSLPGLQAQVSGGAGPGQTLNDGLLVLTLADGRFSVWLGEGCMAQSLGLWPTSDAAHQIVAGGYWGRPYLFDYTAVLDGQTTASASGTVTTGSTSTTLRPNGGHTMHIASDWRRLCAMLLKWNATNGWEGRMIVTYDSTDLTVASAWTNTPANGDLWWTGAIHVAVEFGDWWLMSPGRHSSVRHVQLHLETAMNSSNTLDLAVDSTDVAETGTTFVYSPDTMSSTDAHYRLTTDANAGFIQRVRLTSLLTAARWVLRALTVTRDDVGDPHGG